MQNKKTGRPEKKKDALRRRKRREEGSAEKKDAQRRREVQRRGEERKFREEGRPEKKEAQRRNAPLTKCPMTCQKTEAIRLNDQLKPSHVGTSEFAHKNATARIGRGLSVRAASHVLEIGNTKNQRRQPQGGSSGTQHCARTKRISFKGKHLWHTAFHPVLSPWTTRCGLSASRNLDRSSSTYQPVVPVAPPFSCQGGASS